MTGDDLAATQWNATVNARVGAWPTHWMLRWSNPFGEPGPAPEWSTVKRDWTGWPRDIWEAKLPRGVEPVLPEWWKPGCGWAVHCSQIPPADYQPRRMSIEQKQKMRRGNLKRRIEKAAPLFAGDLMAQELDKQPEYFGIEKVHTVDSK